MATLVELKGDDVFTDNQSEKPYGMKRVYVLESENGLVKIGVSGEFDRRKRTLETQSGFSMKNHFCTEWVSNYSEIERDSHKVFQLSRASGEWFNIPFEKAVETVKNICAEIGDHNEKPKPDIEKIRKICEDLVFGSLKNLDDEETEYIHCEYCQCPKDIWEKSVFSYDGDECKLYAYFLDLIPFYDDITPQQLAAIAKQELPKEFNDITDIDTTVNELISIVIDCGVIEDA